MYAIRSYYERLEGEALQNTTRAKRGSERGMKRCCMVILRLKKYVFLDEKVVALEP